MVMILIKRIEWRGLRMDVKWQSTDSYLELKHAPICRKEWFRKRSDTGNAYCIVQRQMKIHWNTLKWTLTKVFMQSLPSKSDWMCNEMCCRKKGTAWSAWIFIVFCSVIIFLLLKVWIGWKYYRASKTFDRTGKKKNAVERYICIKVNSVILLNGL